MVLVGGGGGRWLGPLRQSLQAVMLAPFAGRKQRPYLARIRNSDLVALKDLIEAGQLTPVIDRACTLGEVAEAIRYLEQRHARGKVVIDL